MLVQLFVFIFCINYQFDLIFVGIDPHLELTQNQEAAYYKRYATIIEDINLEVPDADLELVPFEEFKSDEWVTLDDFRQIAMDMATNEWKMVR